ncbi:MULTISPECIES: ATP-binding protein [unclassified Leptolyngbya]|uniref:sensor histidine kinase n=1 Tax=unclassified Leptolyngbya TaxID=2650499 RepID=UPI001689F6C3|nr:MULTISPECIES: ATP-binding protein [unclassified Leptolyngbya]MBD1909125.1 response regulator [Leptolyngbya sp. FACHB-8]MBD2157499.1 response regulator [Leptolyngbya sp. FACHB-16]
MTQTLRVLVIDDNRSDRALIIRQLQREFSQLETEEIIDAQELEQAIAENNFDAVVTDYQLGWSNGLEVLRAIKARYPRCPVIMFTNTGTEEIAVEALQSGLDDYVLKAPNRYIRVPVALRMALERVVTQQRVALLEIRLQGLLNQVKIGIFRSIASGRIIECNPAFLELLAVESLAQANTMNLLDARGWYAELSELSLPQKQEQEIQLQRGDGTQFWALLTIMLNTVEGISVVDGLLEDITERKQAELTLQQMNASLEARVQERTAQLEAVNQDLEEFVYSVSHDLRTPLRTIQGFAQVLLDEVGNSLEGDNLECLQRIATNAEQLDTLITDLLTYSRLRQTEIDIEPVNLSRALRDALAQLESEIQQKRARIQIREPLAAVQANRLILIQVLTNLLSNALKFVANGTQPAVQIWAEQNGRELRLWIKDNGIGITLKNQQQIFRPFTRLHSEEEYPGTGIGLAIARKGLERMGGQVGVESQPGQGSQFWIELPRAEDSQ